MEPAPMKNGYSRKSERVDVRTTPAVKQLLRQAAAATNKTVSEFIIESGLTEAAEVLADGRSWSWSLGEKGWRAFIAELDALTPPMPRLEKLLREPSVLERRND